MTQPFIYFMENKAGDEIRIGYTSSAEAGRLWQHKTYGHKLLAVIPGTKEQEGKLHSHFSPYLTGRDRSHYSSDAVFPYVQRLLEYNWASVNEDDAQIMSPQPWALWEPAAVMRPLLDGKQACLFVTEGIKSLITDTWQTPQDIADLCRQALGDSIDLDPASCFEANKRIKARHFYDERYNGLIRDWHGSVFLNPPYGGGRGRKDPLAAQFIEKLIMEIESGRVQRALTVLNLQSVCTLWFPKVRAKAVSHAIYYKRIDFIGPKAKSGSGAKAYSSAKNGTIFSFFGDGKETFEKVFKPVAMVVREVR